MFKLLGNVIHLEQLQNRDYALGLKFEELSIWVDPCHSKGEVQCLFNFRRIFDFAREGAVEWNWHSRAVKLFHSLFNFKLCGFSDLHEPNHCWVCENVNDLNRFVGHGGY
ncbi:hypothetical protein PROAA_560014 [Candidatus Propionivibrio aalborgensis]|uniref:Uncharacterized protein n=1 Tax=Candidatus Propionivibrio aalborgensis TaxID=1860101 RepID=A0A1A8Y0V0_9RHOO|nr:hypothetical protein PROAA_560014 [Candidatus Propionivibrio aalborgensis]